MCRLFQHFKKSVVESGLLDNRNLPAIWFRFVIAKDKVAFTNHKCLPGIAGET